MEQESGYFGLTLRIRTGHLANDHHQRSAVATCHCAVLRRCQNFRTSLSGYYAPVFRDTIVHHGYRDLRGHVMGHCDRSIVVRIHGGRLSDIFQRAPRPTRTSSVTISGSRGRATGRRHASRVAILRRFVRTVS